MKAWVNELINEKNELQIAPLIDVVFLLLIYFMVSARLKRPEADLTLAHVRAGCILAFEDDGSLVGVVETAVGKNVGLDAVKNREAQHRFVERCDLLGLLFDVGWCESARVHGALAVIGDAEILETHRFRTSRHLFDGATAVAVRRVNMKEPLDVALPE